MSISFTFIQMDHITFHDTCTLYTELGIMNWDSVVTNILRISSNLALFTNWTVLNLLVLLVRFWDSHGGTNTSQAFPL